MNYTTLSALGYEAAGQAAAERYYHHHQNHKYADNGANDLYHPEPRRFVGKKGAHISIAKEMELSTRDVYFKEH